MSTASVIAIEEMAGFVWY